MKVWLESVAVARNVGYNERDVDRLLAAIAEHRDQWIEACVE
ncbi:MULTISPECIES: hypothetical protein [Rhizobium]|uniref:Uncharacterized protein n=1 Tax=Rhizobium rhododendri TaxID=2506430 RepID=A0ABY8IGP5_9HYPH|nr:MULTISPECIES: hypothetical protein [Rhizobium]WFS22799.1 hypothetical protein PR018_17025 [Rhizobium rhododendri]